MKILAFDTSSSGFSVALLLKQEIVGKVMISEAGKQSEFLILEIEKILKENKIWYQDLDLIATTKGPGSFTGTRIGLTAARTIHLSTNIPLTLFNSCEVVAYKNRHKSPNICTILDARAGDFFYSHNSSEPKLVRIENLLESFPEGDFFLCGSGKEAAAEILRTENRKFQISESKDEIEADQLAFLAFEKFQKGEKVLDNLDPIYLRAPRISERKR
jgi:tRNA threonylcarbamoyladenosine biosynthesis protein TsaB